MNFRDLEVIKILDDERNITSAATKLYISQPSLSYKINTLEQELGVPLLIRSKKGIRFTAQGSHLVDYAKKTLNGFNKMKDYLHSIDNEDEGVIRLGVSQNLARYERFLYINFIKSISTINKINDGNQTKFRFNLHR
ncbi:LysR family transcriptional regulator [Staphylococcus xylosus]